MYDYTYVPPSVIPLGFTVETTYSTIYDIQDILTFDTYTFKRTLNQLVLLLCNRPTRRTLNDLSCRSFIRFYDQAYVRVMYRSI